MNLSDAAYLCGVLSSESAKLEKLHATYNLSMGDIPLSPLDREELRAQYAAAVVCLRHCYERSIAAYAAYIVEH